MIKKIEKILSNGGINEALAEAKLIVTSVSGQSIEEIMSGSKIKNEEEIIKTAEKRVETKRPIQQILGFSYFMGSKYKITEDVLIPRDETEFLVIEGYEKVKNIQSKINILDIGTGTGCISIELAKKLKEKDVEILSVDINLPAIQTALENAEKFGVIRKVIFRKSDLFSKIRECEKFDLIISNPPYIPKNMKTSIQTEVLFEPDSALYTDDEDGIYFYEKIISAAKYYLKSQGALAFEFGAGQSKKVKNLLEINNYKNIRIIKDLAGIDRVISANI